MDNVFKGILEEGNEGAFEHLLQEVLQEQSKMIPPEGFKVQLTRVFADMEDKLKIVDMSPELLKKFMEAKLRDLRLDFDWSVTLKDGIGSTSVYQISLVAGNFGKENTDGGEGTVHANAFWDKVNGGLLIEVQRRISRTK